MGRERVLSHLKALVACDTRNPPRDGKGIDALFAYVEGALAGCGTWQIDVVDLGDGCRWLHARRGDDPHVPLVNVHIDTVPLASAESWTSDPFVLHVGENNVTGLGACDIKGALACFLDAVADVDKPAALLLTSDEEAGSSTCVRTFIERNDVVFRTILVAEPTQAMAVLAHRGIGTAVMNFHGVAGHASQKRAVDDSAISRCVRFCVKALEHAHDVDNGIRLNLGRIEGGTKANMIASNCLLRLGVRPDPGTDPGEVLDGLFALAEPTTTTQKGFLAPPLPARRVDRTVDEARERSTQRALELGLGIGADVDFFTEAAFFSAAGANAIVFGPGDIAQAHAVDEFVAVEQLDIATALYRRVLAGPVERAQ